MQCKLKIIISVIAILSELSLFAQNADPVLMKVNDEQVTRSEYIYYLHKCQQTDAHIRAQEILDRLTDLKLKVDAAKKMKLDSTKQFKSEQQAVHGSLIMDFLVDNELLDSLLHIKYHHFQQKYDTGKYLLKEYLYPLTQHASASKCQRAKTLMDSLYAVLTSTGNPTEKQMSQVGVKVEERWVKRLDALAEIENAMISLESGEISKPFDSPKGVHIVSVSQKTSYPSFVEIAPSLMTHQNDLSYAEIFRHAAIEEKLKSLLHYKSNQSAINSLLTRGNHEGTLFFLNEQPYTGKDFEQFAAYYPYTIEHQLNAFLSKSIYDAADAALKTSNRQYNLEMKEMMDGLLAYEIMDKEVWSQLTEADVLQYKEIHKDGKKYVQFGFHGIVFHTKEKKQVKQIRKLLKQIPEDEWQNAIRLVINKKQNVPQVLSERGDFMKGDNAFVDHHVFGEKAPEPNSDYPFSGVYGAKIPAKECQEMDENKAREKLLSEKERLWLDGLKASAKVEINEEVLKTVNGK